MSTKGKRPTRCMGPPCCGFDHYFQYCSSFHIYIFLLCVRDEMITNADVFIILHECRFGFGFLRTWKIPVREEALVASS